MRGRASPTSPARRLLARFRPYAGRVVLASALMTAQAAVPGALVFLVQRVLDEVLVRKDPVQLALLPPAVVGLYAVSGALNVARGLLTRSMAWDVVTRLRDELFQHLLTLDLGWHQRHTSGELLARITADTSNIQYAVSGVVTALQKPVTLAVLVGSAFYLNAQLAVVALVLLPLVAWPIARFGARLRESSRAATANMAELSALAQEGLAGVRVVQAFGAEARLSGRFGAVNHEQRRLQLRAFLAQLLPGPTVELIAALGVGAVIWVGGRQVFEGTLSPGALIGFLVALGLLNDPLKGVSQIHSLLQRALASAEVIFDLLDTPSRIEDRGSLTLQAREVSVRLEGVRFASPSRDGEPPRWVLRGLDLELPAGRVVAVVGASGAGKSTLAALLSRFYEPSEGRILLNGAPLDAYILASLRAHVAVVSQETFLFKGTVRQNISMFNDLPEARLREALEVANALSFVDALPQGLDTEIDPLGARLSGGQRQRLCIARALLADAPLLVLDEATSALDAESEAAVQEALERLQRGRTVLAIAHRLSTIRDADEIVVLEQGVAVERGRHAELLAREGAYARLFRLRERTSDDEVTPPPQ